MRDLLARPRRSARASRRAGRRPRARRRRAGHQHRCATQRGDGIAGVWRENGSLLVEVADGGHIADPLAGRDLPGPEEIGGRGLFLVNQLCDLVQLRSSPEGSVIRVHMHLD